MSGSRATIMLDPQLQAAAILTAVGQAADAAIVVTTMDGIVVSWNRAAADLYGYTSDEMSGRSIAALMPEGHRRELTEILETLQAGDDITQLAAVGRTKRGQIVDIVLSASPVRDHDGSVIGGAFVVHDVTRRKREERAQRSAELQWRSIIESAVDGIVVIDAHGRIEAFNPAAERLFGYAERDVLGRNVSMLMPAPYQDEHDHYLARYLAEGDARIIGIGREVKGRRRDGTVFPLHLSVGEMSVEGQRKFTGILRDLTARVELEERLRSSEARWRAVIDSAVDGIVVIDATGHIEAFNPAAERLFGYAESDVIGHNVSMLMPQPYRGQHDGYLARYLGEGDPRIIGVGREVTGQRRDGGTFPLHLSVGEMVVHGERKFTGILHDLSTRVALEERLREQTALARLGEMAAVIAHEIKNPLAGIRAAIQIIGGRLSQQNDDTRIITEIVNRIDSLSGLMRDLLLFARPPQPRLGPTDIAPLVKTTANLLSGDPSLHDVRVEIEGSAPLIMADAELLKIVFHNLLINSAHAMHGKGKIHVTVSAADAGCRVAIADAGPGIPQEIRERVFTPFFTTKARGSGLGLPTAKRLVEAHKGHIVVECPQEGGTTVTVQLPAQTPRPPSQMDRVLNA